MQTNIRKELKEITGHLKTYLEETREEDFWQFKEILVNEKQTDLNGKRPPRRGGGKTENGKQLTLQTDFGMHRSGADLEKELNALHLRIKNCQKCGLSKTRINVVFSRGSAEKGIIFIGEAPGYDEDRQGLPFVGRAGQLLDEVLAEVGFKREKVYITNVVKCHPLFNPRTPEKRGNDRPPNKEEIAACLPILREQISIIKPRIICTLGAVATNTLLSTNAPLNKLHGKFYSYEESVASGGIKLLPTFHPAAILRTPSLKNIFINDLKKVCSVASSATCR